MKPRFIILIVVIAIGVIGGGIALSHAPSNTGMSMPSSGGGTAASPAAPNTVFISNYTFTPSALTVKRGTTVTWTNQDIAKHTITADSGTGPMSQLFGKGESYTYTFDTVGSFKYHCEPHPYMHGLVVVTN